uniref:Lachrymatory-factor synthase n=1 Tax=Cajanus cajan TaxID=3821 RepID=A0A151RAH6_CAJCA|nr:Lachrymatory-factor synthase [Cajanus cajan]
MDYSTRKRTRKCKMEGQGTAQVQGFKVEQVWLLLEDFFGLEKWFPHIPTCIPVEGISGKSGCVRFCAGFITPYQTNFNWTKQKLLSIDLAHWTLTYSIVEGNVRVHSYQRRTMRGVRLSGFMKLNRFKAANWNTLIPS